jgi:hypothetical protein
MASIIWHSPASSPRKSFLWAGGESQYKHTFGGPPRHEGAVFAGCTKPVHLLYTIDLADPHCLLELPNARFLPLYYGFQYDATLLWYRVVSDAAIKIVRQEKTAWTAGFPYPNYPEAFPQQSASIGEPASVEELLNEEFWREQWSELTAELKESGDTPDHNDLIALTQGHWQGAWKSRCINPACDNQRMNILAVIDHDDVEGVHFWDKWGEGEMVQIVYEVCPRCSMICAMNQCT